MKPISLYQTVHVHNGKARLVKEHFEVLNRSSKLLFGFSYPTTPQKLKAKIEEEAQQNNHRSRGSVYIRVEWSSEREERIFLTAKSLYEGYALRAVRPRGSIVHYLPAGGFLFSTAQEDMEQQARLLVQRRGADVAISLNSDDEVTMCNGRKVVVIVKNRFFIDEKNPSAEQALIIEALQRQGLINTHSTPHLSDAEKANEIFYFDHRGTTSLSHFEGQPLMSIIAEKTAHEMEFITIEQNL